MNKPTAQTPEQYFAIMPLACIRESLTNPRKSFDPVKLEEMAGTIRAHGVTTPILVRPIGKAAKYAVGEVEIVYGARRFRASKLAGKDSIPAMVQELTDEQVRSLQIIENLQREDVNPIEEAEGYKAMMDDFGYTADKLADAVQRSKAYIYGRLKLCTLPHEIRTIVLDGKLPASTAEVIARMPSVLQLQATNEIIANNGKPNAMSYREACDYIRKRYMLELSSATFPINDIKLVSKAGGCDKCPKRTGNQPELFQDVKSADVCTDPDCFASKNKAFQERIIATARKQGIPVYEGQFAEELYDDNKNSPADTDAYNFDRLIDQNNRSKLIEELLTPEQLPKPIAMAVIDDKAVAIYENKAIEVALEKAGLARSVDDHIQAMKEKLKSPQKGDSSNSSMDKYMAEQEIKKNQAALETKFRLAVYDLVRKDVAGGVTETLIRACVKIMVCDAIIDTNIMEAYYPPELHKQDAMLTHIDTAPMHEVDLLMLDIIVASQLKVYSHSVAKDGSVEADEPLLALLAGAKDAGIDVESIRNEIIPKKQKKEAKPKQVKAEQEDKELQPETAETASEPPKKEKAPAKSKVKALVPEAQWPFPTKGGRV